MNDLNIYIKKPNTLSNKNFSIKERNCELENFVGNYIKNKPNNMDNYMKKNLSYSKLFSTNNKKLPKTKSVSKNNTLNDKTNSFNSNQNININNISNYNSNQSIIKHSSMKYFKVSPIIKPIFYRSYFTPKTDFQNIQTANNEMSANLKNIIKNTKIKEIDEDTPSTSRQTQTFNKLESNNMNSMNNINTIYGNYLNNNKKIKNDKKIVFMKKRIPSCNKKSISKSKEINLNNFNNENDNINKVENNKEIKSKNKKVDNLKFEETCSIYIKNNNLININNPNINENIIKKSKNKNMFNKSNIKKTKTQIKLEEMHKNLNINLRNKYKKDFYTNNNSNSNIDINMNIHEQTKMAFKELNLEDFLLIIQKFDDIINNLKNLCSFSSVDINQNIVSSKKILEINHINRIKLFDLYRFYMGSSFDGCPEKLFSSKKSKYYFHCYTIVFILSIGVLYIISQRIKLTQQCIEEMIKLINLQEKIFLVFCYLIIQKLNKKYKQNLWVTNILDVLNHKLISNITNHLMQIRTLTINSYEIINNLLMTLNKNDNNKNENSPGFQEKYLYNNFFNKNIKNFIEIEINQIEEDFNTNIFKTINLRNNYANLSSFKRSVTVNNFKDMNSSCKKFYNNNNNNYSYSSGSNKNKKSNYNTNYNTNVNTNNYNTSNNFNYFTNNNISIVQNTKNNNKLKNNYIKKNTSQLKNKYIPNNTKNNIHTINNSLNSSSSSIQQYDITIPDTDIVVPPVTIPFLNFSTKKKYTLVMDLDETMVNFKFINSQKGTGKLFIRPYLEIFLEVIKDYYEIISFTSATRDYADIVLDIIEKNKRKKYFDYRLYREHTTQFGKKYIKDLSKLGRDLSKIIIVDNLSQCFKLHGENGILISSFYGEDENDKVLIELQKILIKIFYEKGDVRESINKYKDEIFNKVSKVSISCT